MEQEDGFTCDRPGMAPGGQVHLFGSLFHHSHYLQLRPDSLLWPVVRHLTSFLSYQLYSFIFGQYILFSISYLLWSCIQLGLWLNVEDDIPFREGQCHSWSNCVCMLHS